MVLYNWATTLEVMPFVAGGGDGFWSGMADGVEGKLRTMWKSSLPVLASWLEATATVLRRGAFYAYVILGCLGGGLLRDMETSAAGVGEFRLILVRRLRDLLDRYKG